MSTYASANTINNSLIYSLDIGNIKSYSNIVNNINYVPDTENMTPWCSPANYVSATTDVIVAPDGTTTVDKLVELVGTGTIHIFARTGVLTSNMPYNVSFYAKAGERTVIGCGSNNGLGSCKINLSNGSVLAGSAIVIPLSNGWYKILTNVTPGGGAGIYMGICDATGNNVYDGDGVSGLYAWGFKAELNTIWTNYTSVNGTVMKDILYDGVTSLSYSRSINGPTYSSENNGVFTLDGTNDYIFTPAVPLTGTSTQSLTWSIWVNPSTTGTGDILNMQSGAGWNMCPFWSIGQKFYAKVWNTANIAALSTYITNQWYELSLTYNHATTTTTFYINGVLQGTSAGAYSGSGVSNFFGIGLAGSQATSTYFNGKVSNLKIYNKALSQAEVNQNFDAIRGRYGI